MHPVKNLIVFALMAFSLACNKSIEPVTGKAAITNEGYKEYFIPKNAHSATTNGVKKVDKEYMHFQVYFDSSAIYQTVIPENIYDINKLYGFSDCGSGHHQNSARVGWLWNGSAIELHAYCYADGVRISQLMGTILPGQVTELKISVASQQYIFEWNGQKTVLKRSCSGNRIEGYQLYPYFGGDEIAPHDIRVFVKDLE